MKKRVLREQGKIFTHEEKEPMEKVFEEVVDEIVKPKKRNKKEA